MNDGGEADDKIIAVIKDDPAYGHMNDISELPPTLVHRISHYFQTYKMVPDKANKVSIGNAYGYEHAKVVLAAAMADYDEDYGDVLAE
jgi:inorganic pyrophosphatase